MAYPIVSGRPRVLPQPGRMAEDIFEGMDLLAAGVEGHRRRKLEDEDRAIAAEDRRRRHQSEDLELALRQILAADQGVELPGGGGGLLPDSGGSPLDLAPGVQPTIPQPSARFGPRDPFAGRGIGMAGAAAEAPPPQLLAGEIDPSLMAAPGTAPQAPGDTLELAGGYRIGRGNLPTARTQRLQQAERDRIADVWRDALPAERRELAALLAQDEGLGRNLADDIFFPKPSQLEVLEKEHGFSTELEKLRHDNELAQIAARGAEERQTRQTPEAADPEDTGPEFRDIDDALVWINSFYPDATPAEKQKFAQDLVAGRPLPPAPADAPAAPEEAEDDDPFGPDILHPIADLFGIGAPDRKAEIARSLAGRLGRPNLGAGATAAQPDSSTAAAPPAAPRNNAAGGTPTSAVQLSPADMDSLRTIVGQFRAAGLSAARIRARLEENGFSPEQIDLLLPR